jgi:hypothetical protein
MYLTMLGVFFIIPTSANKHGVHHMKIAQFRMIELEAKVKKFNNKAKKLNLPVIEVKEVSREVREFKRKDEVLGSYIEYMEFVEVEFIGAIPRVGGWAIHSKIEPAAQVEGNFVYTNKGFEPREDLRTTKMVCQHCNINRFRSVVYLLENMDTKEQKLVGKSCLKDFLPETNIAEVLAYLERFENLSSDSEGDDEEFERAPREAFVYPVNMLIAESLILIEKFGYVSKKAAVEYNDRLDYSQGQEKQATSWMLAESNEKVRKALYSDEKIGEIFKSGKVEAVIEFLNAQDSKNDFNYNVQLAIKQAVAPFKMFAFIAAGVNMYWKSVSVAAEKAVSNKVNEFIGAVGERLVFNGLRIVREYVSEGNYGSTFITTMEDPEGRCVVWFASKRVGDIGTFVNLKGTIRDHSMFNLTKQTVITRATKV